MIIFVRQRAQLEAQDELLAAALAAAGPTSPAALAAAAASATAFSEAAGKALLASWTAFFGELFVRFRDGYTVTANAASTNCGCTVASPGYESSWYDRIAADTGDHLRIPASEGAERLKSSTGATYKLRPKTGLKALN